MILTDAEAIELTRHPKNSASIELGAELQRDHKIHVTGEGYKNYIKQIVGYENNEQYAQKQELSEAVTTVLTRRIIDEQSRWKNTSGPKEDYEFRANQKLDKKFKKVLSQVWKGESMKYFINNFLAESLYTEFNGFLIVEQGMIDKRGDDIFEIRDGIVSKVQNNEIKPYIIFRPIENIRDFESKGNAVEYIILNWGETEDGDRIYRVIDDMWDRIIIEKQGEYSLSESKDLKKIPNPLGRVPAIQISTYRKTPADDSVKTSPIWQVLPLLKTYLTNWSEHVITCILHSHPIYYQVGQMCRYSDDHGSCDMGYINYVIEGQPKKKTCPACGGVGSSMRKDASTMINLPQTDEQGQPYSIASVAGYVSPPVEGIKSQREGLRELADQIMQSGTGMNKVMETSIEKTATEAILNYKPLEKIIGGILSNIEYVQTTLTDLIGNMFFGDKYMSSEIVYSRNLNLRDENTVLIEIEQAKKAGASASYIRTLHDELIHSRYQNSPTELERNMMLSQLEPFIGYTPQDLSKDFMGFVDDDTMTLKVYFTDYIVRFETENVLITDYKENQDMNVRIMEIKKIIDLYNKEMLDKIRKTKIANADIEGSSNEA